MTEQIITVLDLPALSQKAAEIIISTGREAIKERGKFLIALSGGRTPKTIFCDLANLAKSSGLDWSLVYIFWLDERCVPPDHVDSNYNLANTELFSNVKIDHIYRMRGEAEDLDKAASDYESILKKVSGTNNNEIPQFDLLLLGIGEDGHVASLFPGTPALEEKKHLIVKNYVPDLKSNRLTMTFPIINNARLCLFVVSGEKKQKVFESVLNGGKEKKLPFHRVQPINGKTIWLVDNDAAAKGAL